MKTDLYLLFIESKELTLLAQAPPRVVVVVQLRHEEQGLPLDLPKPGPGGCLAI